MTDPEPYSPPATDQTVVYWLDTARHLLAEAAERARVARQNRTKEADHG